MDKKEHYKSLDGFCFPFQPYESQLNFMRALYSVLGDGQIGIFESPTGTGKSLSIICGAVKWLKDTQLKREEELNAIIKNCESSVPSGDDWISSFAEEKEKKERLADAKREMESIKKREEYISQLRLTKAKQTEKNFSHPNSIGKKSSHATAFTTEELLEDITAEDSDSSESEECEQHEVIKIFYASRTHSQLSQFLNELKKSPYSNDVTVTTLGSRANLCVNDSVKKLKSHNLVNEKCAELLSMKKSGKTEASTQRNPLRGCPFYNKKQIGDLQESVLSKTCDVEELLKFGKELKACPYYACRNVIPQVELVLLPYNTILHAPTRESYGIKLKGNVVIIDEAHNLIEAVNAMYSGRVDGSCLIESHRQLSKYFTKYSKNFSPSSVRYIKQLMHVLKSLLKFFTSKTTCDSVADDDSYVLSYYDFLRTAGIDQINVFEIIDFCDKSHLGNKLYHIACRDNAKQDDPKDSGKANRRPVSQFLEKICSAQVPTKSPEATPQESPVSSGQSSSFLIFLEFLRTVTLPTECGKYICLRKQSIPDSELKFLHLNPAIHFQTIVKEARSVVLAGGTMSPISDFVNQLLIPAGADKDRIVHHSFDHVVPPENLVVLPVRYGRERVLFDFTYDARHSKNMMDALSEALEKLSVEVPGGIVCFFPSYSYENYVYTAFVDRGDMKRIEVHKPIFREPKESHKADAVLSDYASVIRNSEKGGSSLTGAILFSVVGGKLSEGINFSNELCRCVIMIGLPYGKKNSELNEKITYCNKFYEDGQDYYHIQCMKAVNQSIGRAIRHRMDYAVIMLLDYRYCSRSVKKYLPKWLCNRIVECASFNDAVFEVKRFFECRR